MSLCPIHMTDLDLVSDRPDIAGTLKNLKIDTFPNTDFKFGPLLNINCGVSSLLKV